MTAFTFSMPSGIPGAVNRVGGGASPVIEAVQQDATNPVLSYGLAGVVDATNGTFRLPTTGDTGPTIYGFLVRPYPAQVPSGGSQALGPGTPPGASQVVDALRKGYMTTILRGATAAVKGGIVYVRLVTSGPSVQGSVEAAAGANLIATSWQFMGPADASGNVEIVLV